MVSATEAESSVSVRASPTNWRPSRRGVVVGGSSANSGLRSTNEAGTVSTAVSAARCRRRRMASRMDGEVGNSDEPRFSFSETAPEPASVSASADPLVSADDEEAPSRRVGWSCMIPVDFRMCCTVFAGYGLGLSRTNRYPFRRFGVGGGDADSKAARKLAAGIGQNVDGPCATADCMDKHGNRPTDSAKLVCPMSLTPEHYASLRRYLDSPPPQVISDWPEFIHPHDLPPNTDPPRTFVEAADRVWKMPWMQGMVCVTEMAAVLIDHLDQQPSGGEDDAPPVRDEFVAWVRQSIVRRRAVLDGTIPWAEQFGGEYDFTSAHPALVALPTTWVFIEFLLDKTKPRFPNWQFSDAEEADFLALLPAWWRRCAARLAVVDALTVPFEAPVESLSHFLLHAAPDYWLLGAIDALGAIGDPRAVPALTTTLHDTHRGFRSRAAEALGEIGPDAKDAVPALIEVMFHDHVRSIREQAQRAIIAIGHTAVPPVLEILCEASAWQHRRKAAEILEGMGAHATSAVPVLRHRFLVETSPSVRAAIESAIQKILPTASQKEPRATKKAAKKASRR